VNGQLALWEPEPCHTAAAPAPRPRTTAADPGAVVRLVTTDHGHPAGRPFPWGRAFTDVSIRGDLL
jgi:hypothetical protein